MEHEGFHVLAASRDTDVSRTADVGLIWWAVKIGLITGLLIFLTDLASRPPKK